MYRKICLNVALATLLGQPLAATAATDADLQAIREQIQQLKQSYEQRISQLEQRLQQAEAGSKQAQQQAAEAQATAQQTLTQPVIAAPPSGSESAFNPAIAFILSGTYGNLRQDPAVPATGFAMSANNPGYSKGFSLKESELGISANIDPDFRGVATLALAPAGGVTVENAFVQTASLGHGINLKMGRFFSGLGYLNEQHAHVWDFVDQPLVYRTFWDNQTGEDGLQAKWLAPTDMFLELGGEIGRGRGYPGTDRNKNGTGSSVLYAHIGDDIGIEQSWQAGVSLHQTQRVNAISPDASNPLLNDSFSGDSRTAGVDFVWKYAPNGNIADRYLKVQGEYFQRRLSGMLTYDTAGLNVTDNYSNTQNGWYLQSVYQFMPHWRTGLRYDRLDPGTANVGALNAANIVANFGYLPSRTSVMLDYSPSEFSRFRLQLSRDLSRQGLPDNQIFVQYIMSLGAHGAHQY
ncbi:MAG: TonB-dependent receptor [Gallionella sp.]|nr:TonB-dependent receptor [Gallionella sp.]MDD4945662.1 TonB-dependent receptor [Gallionella sp.]